MYAEQTWGDVLVGSFQNIWGGVANFLPRFIVAIIIFVVGWVVAVALGNIISRIIKSLKVDRALQSLGLEEPLARAGYRLDAGAFIGGLVRWFFIVIFLVASMNVLELGQVNSFLSSVVLGYLPNVIAAALILIVAAVVADAMQRIIMGGARAAEVPSAGLMGGVTKWAIWVFAILAALYQLGVAGVFAQTLFTGFVAMLALGGGLAIGLGGKEAAARYIEKMRKDIASKD